MICHKLPTVSHIKLCTIVFWCKPLSLVWKDFHPTSYHLIRTAKFGTSLKILGKSRKFCSPTPQLSGLNGLKNSGGNQKFPPRKKDGLNIIKMLGGIQKFSFPSLLNWFVFISLSPPPSCLSIFVMSQNTSNNWTKMLISCQIMVTHIWHNLRKKYQHIFYLD